MFFKFGKLQDRHYPPFDFLDLERAEKRVKDVHELRSTNEDPRPICERHLFLDFVVFNSQTLTLMLKEDTDEDVTLLLQLPLQCIEDQHFVTVESSRFGQACTVNTLDIGALLPRASASYQNNALGWTIAVGGIRTTASMLLMSQRRVRLFLLEDGNSDEEDDDEEEEDEKEDTTQEDSTLDYSRLGAGDRAEGDDKENIED